VFQKVDKGQNRKDLDVRMADNHIAFYTKTMAKVYTDQGHWEKAAEVYRYLLNEEPNRQDLKDALREIESIRSDSKKKVPENLISLFTEWIELMLDYNKISKLKALRRLLQAKDY